jgi:precorrin-6A/cobalt-precorrin-6A reductase
MAEKILILGGTREASLLAAELAQAGDDVTTSLAGRTKEPRPVAGKVRIGGFGGATGLAEYLMENGFDRLIDATHPFARQISDNAELAAKQAGIAFEQRIRAPWRRKPGDDWKEFRSLDDACDALPADAKALMALGSQHISAFANRGDVHFVIRMIDPPSAPLPLPDHALILGRPGESADDEAALMRAHAITHVVCRNSGGTGGYAKIEAARMLKLPVFIINR